MQKGTFSSSAAVHGRQAGVAPLSWFGASMFQHAAVARIGGVA